VLAAPEALHPILSGCDGIDALVPRDGQPPAFDLHCPLMSLPAVLGTTLATIPAEIPYLHADPALVEFWRHELAAIEGYKVGIAWQGNPRVLYDRTRSIPLRSFEPLARVEGVRLVSLQKGFGTEQIAALGGRFEMIDLGERLDETAGALMDTAAVMVSLDLVVTCDTVFAHLAGALGVRAWVALPAVPDWRWLLDRGDSPWYPTLRLFRQTHTGSWAEPFERMASALAQAAHASSPGAPSLAIGVSPGELIDRITILEIKNERIADPDKLGHVRAELADLRARRDQLLRQSPALDDLAAELLRVNEAIWQAEDELRLCERAGDFGPSFVTLARSVYRHNDRRATLKRQVDNLLGSRRGEEKLYTSYEGQGQP
jgi:hypothetical protein